MHRGKERQRDGAGDSLVFGRILGWGFVILAIVMASAEAVMALGTGAYNGLATAEVWTLIVGQSPWDALDSSNQFFATIGAIIMSMPAWLVLGLMGLISVHAFRQRQARRRRFRTVN